VLLALLFLYIEHGKLHSVSGARWCDSYLLDDLVDGRIGVLKVLREHLANRQSVNGPSSSSIGPSYLLLCLQRGCVSPPLALHYSCVVRSCCAASELAQRRSAYRSEGRHDCSEYAGN